MVSMYYPNVNNITVIFWDLNNLKIINDTYGHEYGDKALSALASVLYAHSDEQCRRVYRFGGDEFVMIIDNPHDGEADRIISAVKDELMKCSYDISIENTKSRWQFKPTAFIKLTYKEFKFATTDRYHVFSINRLNISSLQSVPYYIHHRCLPCSFLSLYVLIALLLHLLRIPWR